MAEKAKENQSPLVQEKSNRNQPHDTVGNDPLSDSTTFDNEATSRRQTSVVQVDQSETEKADMEYENQNASHEMSEGLPKRRKMKVEEVWSVDKRHKTNEIGTGNSIKANEPAVIPLSKQNTGFKIQEPGSREDSPRISSKFYGSQSAAIHYKNRLNKQMADKWSFIAGHFMQIGQHDTAIEYLQHALKYCVHHVPSLINLGLLYDFLGRTYDAFIVYMRALIFGGEDRSLISDSVINRVTSIYENLDKHLTVIFEGNGKPIKSSAELMTFLFGMDSDAFVRTQAEKFRGVRVYSNEERINSSEDPVHSNRSVRIANDAAAQNYIARIASNFRSVNIKHEEISREGKVLAKSSSNTAMESVSQVSAGSEKSSIPSPSETELMDLFANSRLEMVSKRETDTLTKVNITSADPNGTSMRNASLTESEMVENRSASQPQKEIDAAEHTSSESETGSTSTSSGSTSIADSEMPENRSASQPKMESKERKTDVGERTSSSSETGSSSYSMRSTSITDSEILENRSASITDSEMPAIRSASMTDSETPENRGASQLQMESKEEVKTDVGERTSSGSETGSTCNSMRSASPTESEMLADPQNAK